MTSISTVLVEAHEEYVKALKNLQAKQEQPVVSSEELEARSEELQQLIKSLKKSLEDEEEFDQKNQTTENILEASYVICCVECVERLCHARTPAWTRTRGTRPGTSPSSSVSRTTGLRWPGFSSSTPGSVWLSRTSLGITPRLSPGKSFILPLCSSTYLYLYKAGC